MGQGLTSTNMKPRNRKAGPGKKKDGTQKWKHMGTGNAKHGSRKLESKVTEVKKKLGLGSQKTRAQKKDEEGPRSEIYCICDPGSEKHETRK